MSGVIDHVLSLHGWVVYALVFLFVFAEDAVFVGFVVPGETAAVVGGVAASRRNAEVAVMCAVVVVAAIIGDSVGYEVGKKFGPAILRSRYVGRHLARIDGARSFLARRGGSAVFLGRFTAFFRAVIPALSGMSGMPYRRFLPWNAIGGITWGITFVLVGYLAGNSYTRVEKLLGRGFAVVAVVVVIGLLVALRIRERRRADELGTHERTVEDEAEQTGESD